MKVIMLDVDGVLNSRKGWHRDRPKTCWYLTPECVEQLGRIVKAIPDVKFVLSSCWRHHMDAIDFQAILKKSGVVANFIGETPTYHDSVSVQRGQEIQSWLDNSKVKVDEFVILDDDSDMLHLMPKLVQTKGEDGLTIEIADEVIRRLS